MSETLTYYLSHDGTPLYDTIRGRTGIDPEAIGARPFWSFREASMRLFGEVPNPAVNVGKVTRRAG